MDRLDRLGLACQYSHLHPVSSPGQMELEERRRGGPGRPGLQFLIPGTT